MLRTLAASLVLALFGLAPLGRGATPPPAPPASPTPTAKASPAPAASPLASTGCHILYTESGAGRVVELDRGTGQVVWERAELPTIHKAARLPGGRTLVSSAKWAGLVDRAGKVLWEHEFPTTVKDLEALPGALGVVCEPNGGTVTGLGPDGQPRWQLTELGGPTDAQVLPNGNLLVACQGTKGRGAAERKPPRIAEYTTEGKLVRERADQDGDLTALTDALRLASGNTLVCTRKRVFELDAADQVVWEFSEGLVGARDISVFPNGNVLVTDQDGKRILEIDRATKRVVWEKTGLANPMDADVLSAAGESLELPPTPPVPSVLPAAAPAQPTVKPTAKPATPKPTVKPTVKPAATVKPATPKPSVKPAVVTPKPATPKPSVKPAAKE